MTVAIIALIATMVLPKINNRNNELRSMVRKISVISRDLRSRAKLNNATYRLVINMGEEGEKNPRHEIWVESATGEVLNNYDPENPPTPRDQAEDKKEEGAPAPAFMPDPKVMKKPEVLPSQLIFESVEIGTLDEPITSGIVYIHYLPSGFADEAAIHLKSGEKLKWTLAIDPLTGRVDIINEFRNLEDLRAK
ncbi:MAG: hypothetical protein KDD38_01140 [Bdellovibrionales bacterium]|nr:hypothetical protein [Bdellovibrionales bacterium]